MNPKVISSRPPTQESKFKQANKSTTFSAIKVVTGVSKWKECRGNTRIPNASCW